MESPEHAFVTGSFLRAAEELARSDIFGYTEADRGRFDFACLLVQHKERVVVGQTLRSHAAGIEKDLNWLLMEAQDSIPIYLYADTARHVARIGEVVANARHRLANRVGLLRLYPFPVFDADDERQRVAVWEHIRERVLDDLLLNVMFGRLTEGDIALFVNGVGIAGLQLAALQTIATEGFTNFSVLGRTLEINGATIRPRVFNLLAAGMLRTRIGGSMYYLTQRGRVFLRVAAIARRGLTISSEALFIFERLGLLIGDPGLTIFSRFPDRTYEENRLGALQHELDASEDLFGVRITGGPYVDDPQGRLVEGAFDRPGWIER